MKVRNSKQNSVTLHKDFMEHQSDSIGSSVPETVDQSDPKLPLQGYCLKDHFPVISQSCKFHSIFLSLILKILLCFNIIQQNNSAAG